MMFSQKCVRYLLETISVIRTGIDLLDEDKKVKAGALLGSQVIVLTDFLRKNHNLKTVSKTIKEFEVESKELAKELMKKDMKPGKPGYIG